MFLARCHRLCIGTLIWFFRHYQISPDYSYFDSKQTVMVLKYVLSATDCTIVFRVHRVLMVATGILNSILSAACGVLIAYSFQNTILTSLKIGTCLITIGYYLRVFEYTEDVELICLMISTK